MTQGEIPPFAAVGVTRKMSDKTRWASFFGNLVRVNEQHFDLSIREVIEL